MKYEFKYIIWIYAYDKHGYRHFMKMGEFNTFYKMIEKYKKVKKYSDEKIKINAKFFKNDKCIEIYVDEMLDKYLKYDIL